MSGLVEEKAGSSFPANPFVLNGSKYDFWSEAHCLAAEQLDFAIDSGAPLILFSGDTGLGKSTVVRKLVQATNRHRLIGELPRHEAYDHLPRTAILHALGAQTARGYRDADQATFSESLALAKERVGYPVVILDDCGPQNVAKVEEMLALGGISTGQLMFKLVLVGGTDLPHQIEAAQPHLVGPSIELRPMNEADTIAYVHHRLAVDGFDYLPFSQKALQQVFKYTGGSPLKTNVICTFAMDEARAQDRREIDEALIDFCAEAANFKLPRDVAAED